MYFSLANTCERNGLTSAGATSSMMRRKAAIAGLGFHNTDCEPLVHSESVDSIPTSGKICAEFDHLTTLGRDDGNKQRSCSV